MHRIISTGILPVLFCLVFSIASAQEPGTGPQKEYNLGAGIGKNVFVPRLMLRKVSHDRATRFSLRLRGSTLNYTGAPGSSDGSIGRSDHSMNIDLGYGREKRRSLGKGLSIYYGGDIRAGYGIKMSRGSVSTEGSNLRVEETSRMLVHAPGLSLDGFAGLLWQPFPGLSLSVEAGPSLGGNLNMASIRRSRTEFTGTSTPVVTETSQHATSLSGNLRLFAPVFIQAGLCF